MPARSRSMLSKSPEETADLARDLGPYLQAGDVLLLSGEVGAGKTHFARSLILGLLDSPEDVPSPTYTLIQTYTGRSGEIWHADLYWLTDTSEIEELGLVDAFTEAICLVEWPDRLGDLTPESALTVRLSPGDDDAAREILFDWHHPRWDNIISGQAHA